jgi:hypothetical protein
VIERQSSGKMHEANGLGEKKKIESEMAKTLKLAINQQFANR